VSGRLGKMDRKEALKSLIKKLHSGVTPAEIKEQFKEAIEGVTPTEIAQIEEELIEEGMPREEVQRLCDVHIAVFKESLEQEAPLAPPGHPIRTLMEEHKALLEFAGELKDISGQIKKETDLASASEEMGVLDKIVRYMKDSESHYLREENVLFPYLEKNGVIQPPAIMWSEHNKIREVKKSLYKLADTRNIIAFRDFGRPLEEVAVSLAEMLSSHFYKENNILFPTALKVIAADEWGEIRKQFDELGYCSFTPRPVPMAIAAETPVSKQVEGLISFETGSMSREELETILDTLPVDIIFVDKNDTVRYFSQSEDRIFTRTKAVIGRKVQQCHPQQSLPKVIQILEDFRNGRRNTAEFWINLKGRLIHIRYFAVRSKDEEYLGCIEVTQDITDIQKITGEKRLLD